MIGRAELVRRALMAVVEHWPMDLSDMHLSVPAEEPGDHGRIFVRLTRYDLGVKYGQKVAFSQEELAFSWNALDLRKKVEYAARQWRRSSDDV